MRTFSWIAVVAVVFVSGGATCTRQTAPSPFPPPPVVFNGTPTLQDIIKSVNRTDAIRELSTNSAEVDVLSMPSLPTLSATVNLQRQRNFRFQAKLPVVMGNGIDMGSNNESFWLEVPDGFKRKLFYARHDEFQNQIRRSILPVDPTWLIDAIGLVHIDPASVVAGPVTRTDGSLEIRTTMPTAAGMYQRVYLIDPQGGFVTHQFVESPDGRQIATAVNSNHRYYDSVQCALPHRVQFELTPAAGPPIAMQIDIVGYAINQLLSGSADLFVMPSGNAEPVDLIRMDPNTMTSKSATQGDQIYTATNPTALPMRGRY